MRFNLQDIFEDIDWWMLGASVLLFGLGLLLVYSLTWPDDNRFIKQLVFFGLALLGFFAIQIFDVHFWRNASVVLYIIIVILLLGLLLFAEPTRGTRGWIRLGPVALQVAEFAKLITIIFLATTLEKLHFDLGRFKHVLLALTIVGIPALFTLLQPDFGSMFILAVSGGVMILYTGLQKKVLLGITCALLVTFAIGWFGVLQPYQKDRVLTFMNPQADPLGAGYNVTQAMVAIGSGGLWGRGIGAGTQSQLNFLPEQETDFIFASLAEELGFVGSVVLLILYLFVLWRLYKRMSQGANLFLNFVTIGIFTLFMTQGVINIGMNMGLFPVTGITLPFVSYGGSSLIVSYLSLGLIQQSSKAS